MKLKRILSSTAIACLATATAAAIPQSGPCNSGSQHLWVCDDVQLLTRFDIYDTPFPSGQIIGVLPAYMFDIAVHPVTGQMYGCTQSQLYLVDKQNASGVLVGAFGPGFVNVQALEFSGAGELYARNGGTSGGLLRVDRLTGQATQVGASGPFSVGDLACVGDLSAYSTDLNNALLSIDLATGASTPIGPLDTHGSHVQGFDIDCDGRLFALNHHRELFRIDPATGASTYQVTLFLLAGNVMGMSLERSLGTRYEYCPGGTTSAGCQPTLGATGTPSAQANSGFTLRVTSADGQRPGLIFFGVSGQFNQPWAPGSTSTLCVRPPLQRTPGQLSTGTVGACDGVLSLDWNAYMATHALALGSPRFIGQAFDAQAWMRDPPAVTTTNLSAALHFELVP